MKAIKEQLKRKSNVKVRFAVVSDVHLTHAKEGYDPFDKTMKALSELDLDAYVFAGDMVYMTDKAGDPVCNTLYPKAYDLLNEIMDTHAPDTKKIIAMGNHEYPQCDRDREKFEADCVALFKEKTGHDMNEHTDVFGYHFITMGSNRITPETEAWAKQEIDKAIADDNNKPVFVINHIPPSNTVIGSGKWPGAISEDFHNFLNSRPQVINIVGHLHTPAQEPKTIWQDGFTVIHTPMNAVGYIVFNGCDIGYMHTYDRYAQALVMDIEDDVVTVHRVDIIQDAVVGDTWTIDVNNKENWKYTNKRFEADIIPYFEEDTEIETSYSDGLFTMKFKDAVCEENDIESFAEYYNIKITDEAENIILSERIASKFYFVNRSGYFNYAKNIYLKGRHVIEITPESSFYKLGKTISKTIEI